MKISARYFRPLSAVLLGANLLLASSCWLVVVGAAAAGTVAYVDGNLESSLGNRYEPVVAATNTALVQLGYAKAEERKDALTDTFVTHTANGSRVEVIVTNVHESLTKVNIRIGTFGDQQMSQSILEKIKSNL